MSVSVGDTGGGRGGKSQDFELNLASIIDCLTVLIAFLLASASFLSIGILEAGVAAAGDTAKSDTPPSLNITVELAQNHGIAVKYSGKSTGTENLQAKADAWNYEELTKQLSALKQKHPDVSAVTLSAANDIEYRDVVKTMEVMRKTLPVVLLGGF